MMFVFCSNSLIFTPECWKFILRDLDFKIFPKTRAIAASFFVLTLPTPKLLHLFKILLKTLRGGGRESAHLSLLPSPLLFFFEHQRKTIYVIISNIMR